ncbi:hypothetical protein M405DRAFT_818503, partial [Rhizopogon salebrosus TDB-379]
MPSCVRAPYQTSEPSAMSSIARVLLSVLICQIFLISIACCCIRCCMLSPLPKFLLLASP